MSDRLKKLQEAVEAGELESWIGALAAVWLQGERGSVGERPTPEDLGVLLNDAQVLARLKKDAPDGPWDVLAAQARSVRSHGHLGDALRELSELL